MKMNGLNNSRIVAKLKADPVFAAELLTGFELNDVQAALLRGVWEATYSVVEMGPGVPLVMASLQILTAYLYPAAKILVVSNNGRIANTLEMAADGAEISHISNTIRFENSSRINVVMADESVRGNRATRLIVSYATGQAFNDNTVIPCMTSIEDPMEIYVNGRKDTEQRFVFVWPAANFDTPRVDIYEMKIRNGHKEYFVGRASEVTA
jgi:hypothetical protein